MGKSIKKANKEKLGIHPINTAILIIIVVIVIVVLVYFYFLIEGRAGHAIQIQNVKFEKSKTLIYVQNIGKGSVIVDLVYFDEKKFEISEENCTVNLIKTNLILERQTCEIIVNEGYVEKVYIRVVCRDGTLYEGNWQPPS